jgi:hypothetical protein
MTSGPNEHRTMTLLLEGNGVEARVATVIVHEKRIEKETVIERRTEIEGGETETETQTGMAKEKENEIVIGAWASIVTVSRNETVVESEIAKITSLRQKIPSVNLPSPRKTPKGKPLLMTTSCESRTSYEPDWGSSH